MWDQVNSIICLVFYLVTTELRSNLNYNMNTPTLDILPTLTTKPVLKSITLQRYFNETCSPWPYSWPLLIQDKINLITWRKIIIALCDCFFFFCAVVKLGQRKMVCLCCYLIFHEWHYPFPILLHDCFFDIIASFNEEQ